MRFFFADRCLDTDQHSLSKDGEDIHVEPQVFDILVTLAESAGRLVTYDMLIENVWNGRIVSDATMAARISASRAAVGDTGKEQRVIKTVARRGIQLVALLHTDQDVRRPVISQKARQSIEYATSRDGTGIAFACTGEGPPLLRGGHWMNHLEADWQSPVFGPLIERLGAGRRLVRYDPRGTGLSERILNAATIEHFVDDMEAVADAAGLERFPIFGISQSVPIALAFAARCPDRVSRLILCNGMAKGSNARGASDQTEAMVAMILAGWGVRDSAFMRAFATLFLPGGTREEIDSFVELQAISASPQVAANLRRAIGDIDVEPLLDRVKAPVLVCHTTGDAVQPVEQSQLMARKLPNARMVLYESQNHVIPPSDPVWADVTNDIDSFLAEPDV